MLKRRDGGLKGESDPKLTLIFWSFFCRTARLGRKRPLCGLGPNGFFRLRTLAKDQVASEGVLEARPHSTSLDPTRPKRTETILSLLPSSWASSSWRKEHIERVKTLEVL